MTSQTRGVEDAGVSNRSTIIGVLSCVSAGLLKTCLLNTQGFVGALASEYGCQQDRGVEERPEGTGGNQCEAFQPSSLQFWPNITRGYSRPRRRSRGPGGSWDMGPCNGTLVPAQSIQSNKLLAPILPQRPSESCHHMGSRWASSGVSICTSALHGIGKRYCCSKEHTYRKAQQTTRKV